MMVKPKHTLLTTTVSLLVLLTFSVFAEDFDGYVEGYESSPSEVEVILETRGVLRVESPDTSGKFTFEDVAPGKYAVKVRAPGHKTTPARIVTIPLHEPEEPFRLEMIATQPFVFHWEEDQSTAGFEYSASVATPRKVTFLDRQYAIVDTAASLELEREFDVSLVNDEMTWSHEHAYRLLMTFDSIPIHDLNKSKWTITEDELHNDIEIESNNDGSSSVRISNAVFVNANPRVVEVDGKRGFWYSNRLHHAVTRYITDRGRDRDRVEHIMNENFGMSQMVRDYAALTGPTTGETSASFQAFHSEELVQIINLLQDMPRGFHVIPELKYFIRRIDGMPHPLYPTAPAVAWPEQGYVEFMDSAFFNASVDDIHRLVLHEKSHFLWSHVFDDQLKADWIELGGWYEDPNARSGWSTTLTTQFVSAYAHLKNPNEDMAESVADFVINPDVLRSRASLKYDFVRDRVMQGNIYVSEIREDLQFEVYNLFPDYVFPGKIKRIDIEVAGESEADKELNVTLELHAIDFEKEGASHAYTRITNDIGTHIDLYLYPIDENGEYIDEGIVLFGSKVIPKEAKAGYWYPLQMVIRDLAGNNRYQRDNDFGWKMYVDNALEDYTEPRYVPGSARLAKRDETVTEHGVEYDIQVIEVTWQVDEDGTMKSNAPCYARLTIPTDNSYYYDHFGDHEDGVCLVEFVMPEYMPTATYSLRLVVMTDSGLNQGRTTFNGENEPIKTLALVTSNPDLTPAEIDINRIYVDAEPTNPEQPNGETIVNITFYIRDDNSGFRHVAMRLRDPLGGQHFQWHEGPDPFSLYPRTEPNKWYKRQANWILPPGSLPGNWGLASMRTHDRARNQRNYDFTETILIEVQNSMQLLHVVRGGNFSTNETWEHYNYRNTAKKPILRLVETADSSEAALEKR